LLIVLRVIFLATIHLNGLLNGIRAVSRSGWLRRVK
jgi:hypothetical protein